jgi:hypothetical protein
MVDHNIQVVVLPDPSDTATATNRDSLATSIATTAGSLFLSTASASKEAMMYSRSRLVEGPPVDEKNRKSKNKHVKPGNKRKHELEAQQPLWKRSKQMRFIAVGSRHRRGMAAPLFAKNKSGAI